MSTSAGVTGREASPAYAIVSGYFNPLHVGHLDLMEAGRALADRLIVIVNNDDQQLAKKGRIIQDQASRLRIVQALRVVDEALVAVDDDGTVCATLDLVRSQHPERTWCSATAATGPRRRPRQRPRPVPGSASGSSMASAASTRLTPAPGSSPPSTTPADPASSEVAPPRSTDDGFGTPPRSAPVDAHERTHGCADPGAITPALVQPSVHPSGPTRRVPSVHAWLNEIRVSEHLNLRSHECSHLRIHRVLLMSRCPQLTAMPWSRG